MEDEDHLTLNMVVDGYQVSVIMLMDENEPVPQWAGSMIQVKGVYAPRINAGGDLTLIYLWSPGVHCVTWLSSLANTALFERPVRTIESFLENPEMDMALVRGEYVGQSRSGALLLRDDTGQISVASAQETRPRQGDVIEIVGMTQAIGVEVTMSDALWRPSPAGGAQRVEMDSPRLRHRVAVSVRELSPMDAATGQPVRITGVITWADADRELIYLQDSSAGIAVRWNSSAGAIPLAGKLVSIEGVTAAGDFAPYVAMTTWEEVADVELPTARPITRDQAMTGLEEAQLVELTGLVYNIEKLEGELRLDVTTSLGEMVVRVAGEIDGLRWLGSVITATGVCVAQADEARRLIAAEIWVADARGIEVLQGGVDDPFDRPLTPMREVGRFNPNAILRDRLRLEGTVVWLDEDGEIWINDEGVTLPVHTRQNQRPEIGERIEVVGFLGVNFGQRLLREVVWRSVDQSRSTGLAGRIHEIGELEHGVFAKVPGMVRELFSQGDRVRLMLATADHPVLAVEIDNTQLEAIRSHAPVGSQVEISGLVLHTADMGPTDDPSVRLVVYGLEDVVTLNLPPWWARERLMVFGLLAVLLVAMALLWVALLRRVVRKQTDLIHEQNTRAREMQDELQRTQRLESMGSMAEGITQDFEHLLQRIHRQISEVLSGERLSWETRNRLDQSQAAVLRAQDLTRRLASFSPTGKSVLQPMDWLEFLQREVESFEVDPSIRLLWEMPEGAEIVRMDAGQFQQVIRAILRNSLHAMPRGGSIRISVAEEEVPAGDLTRLLTPGSYLRTRFVDEGGGISAKDLNRVFNPYFTRKDGAKGLGLAVAYAVIRQHRGRIEIESNEGKGTTVNMWLPLLVEKSSE